MNRRSQDPLSQIEMEAMLAQNAPALRYPPTPDIAATITDPLLLSTSKQRTWLPQSRLAWAIALLILCIALLTVPPVRAAILDFIQVGAVRIWLVEPTSTPPPAQSTVIVAPTSTPRTALLPLKGATTLAEARSQTGWAIPLPTYPLDLGEPDAVYLQDMDGDVVVLVWMDRRQPERVRMSLHLLRSNVFVWKKVEITVVEQTPIGNLTGVWTTGPYLLVNQQGNFAETRLIQGHVLIWEKADITYRLETDSTLAEAVKIAESLE